VKVLDAMIAEAKKIPKPPRSPPPAEQKEEKTPKGKKGLKVMTFDLSSKHGLTTVVNGDLALTTVINVDPAFAQPCPYHGGQWWYAVTKTLPL
jgi:hypothetical protein